jgi:hypothetical protein
VSLGCRKLAAELDERALLVVVERREGARDAGRVLREQALDQLLAGRRDGDDGGAAVVLEPAAADQAAALERVEISVALALEVCSRRGACAARARRRR